MSNVGQSIRAFRPSRYAQADEYDEETQQEKLANMELYAYRAQAGLPLFEDGSDVRSSVIAAKKLTSR